MKKPIIGVTLDSEEAGGWSKLPWYAVRQNYCDSIAKAGGVPVTLPHQPEMVDEYLGFLNGLLVTGGNFDVDPAMFGATTRHTTVRTKDRRTLFEYRMIKGALERNLPVLGICGGQQLLNVVLGGSLIQHIPDEVKTNLNHEQPNPRTEPGHEVIIKANTLLHRICQTNKMPVNSAHHQAVKAVVNPVIVNALAPDGVVEGIEDPRYRFCLGVQWHPEYEISEGDRRIFQAMVSSAAQTV